MQHYLHVSKNDFKKVAWILDDVPVYGYKLKYENIKENIYAEFSIYNDKFKEIILNEHKSKFVLPFHITSMLCILKFFYYQIPLLDKKTFANIKRFTLNTAIGRDSNSKFLVLDAV
jgi:hypothetical protein